MDTSMYRVTQLGLVRYLVKFVAKIEPTFTLSIKQNKTEVDKYFTTRLTGAPEVATTLLSFQIAGSSWITILLKKGGSWRKSLNWNMEVVMCFVIH